MTLLTEPNHQHYTLNYWTNSIKHTSAKAEFIDTTSQNPQRSFKTHYQWYDSKTSGKSISMRWQSLLAVLMTS